MTMTSAPQADETLVIVRRTEQKQETDYVTGGGFSAKSHEDALDRLTLMVQDLEEKINRALKLAETTPTTAAPTLPEPEAREHLRWNEAGSDLENVKVAELGSLSFSITADNRLVKSDDSSGVQETGITVDDGDNVSGVNNFNCTAIDANASQEVMQLDNNTIAFTTSSGAFTLRNIGTDDFLAVTGCNSGATGGNFRLYGQDHASQANDIELRSTTSVKQRWDDSANLWDFLGNTINGVFALVRASAASALTVSGGTNGALGANIRLFGESHASQANDIEFRTGGTVRMRWDQIGSRWDFQDTNLYGVSAIIRNTTNDTLFLTADTVSTAGANIVLYGSTHSSQANDIFLRNGATSKLHYDDSAGEWNFQNIPIVNVSQMVMQGARHIHANVSSQFCVYSGGNDGPDGGNILVYGSAHASLANNMYLRSGPTSRLNWDDGQGNWNFSGNDIVGLGDLTTNSGPMIVAGTGSPESSITAPTGSLYLRSDGGSGTSLYVKEIGIGNTGWVAK